MSKFKPGDKVVRTGGANYYNIVVGRTYTIKESGPYTCLLEEVRGGYDQKYFELAPSDNVDYKAKFENAAKVLYEEGERRGWCEEYDKILARAGMPPRPRPEIKVARHYVDQDGTLLYSVIRSGKIGLVNLQTGKFTIASELREYKELTLYGSHI